MIDVAPADGGQYVNSYRAINASLTGDDVIDIIHIVIIATMLIGVTIWAFKRSNNNDDN